MQQHIIQQDTGLTPAQQGERAALVHLWALRIQNLMHVSNCAARWAFLAIEANDAQTDQPRWFWERLH